MENQLETIDLRKHTFLINLGLQKNPIKSIDLTANTNLKRLGLNSNRL
jgi:hypothetical protein